MHKTLGSIINQYFMGRHYLLFFLLFSFFAFAQDFNRVKMDSLFTKIESNDKGMGSISIFRNGQAEYERAIGYANIKRDIKATPESIYRIGSISKTFTATLIMQLIDEDKLSLDTPLSGFFPQVINADSISIERLLRHQSGVFNFTDAEDFKKIMEKPMSKEDMLRRIVEHGSVFKPGEKTEYSNTNYILLTLIIEKLSQNDYNDQLKAKICEPCGLNSTYYGSEISVDRNEAQSYFHNQKWKPATETDMSIPMGAGALVSTAHDLNVFLQCLFSGVLMSEESFDKMTSLEDNFGMGLFQVPFYEKKALGHNGGIDGFNSNAFYFPEDKVSIVYLSNGANMVINNILIGALSIYFNRPYELPKFEPAIEVDPDDLDQYLGVYASPNFPMKVTIFKKKDKLRGQATGQDDFPLEAYEEHRFRFEQAGIKLEFKPEEDIMILRQGGATTEFKKEE